MLILPNYTTLRQLGLLDTLLGVMIPFFASSMGLLLLRGAYKSIPSAIADAARIDGAGIFQTLLTVYIPSTRQPMWHLPSAPSVRTGTISYGQ